MPLVHQLWAGGVDWVGMTQLDMFQHRLQVHSIQLAAKWNKHIVAAEG